MRRVLSLPAALILIAALGVVVASADPLNAPDSLLGVRTCDGGATTSIWVVPTPGAQILDTSSTATSHTLAFKLYSNGQLIFEWTLAAAPKVPERLTTVCTGYVLSDPSRTFWELSLLTPANT